MKVSIIRDVHINLVYLVEFRALTVHPSSTYNSTLKSTAGEVHHNGECIQHPSLEYPWQA